LGKLLREEFKTSDSDTSAQLNIGTILSKLDGIGNYNGMIIVFLTNFMDKLDDALLRDGRLTPIEFKKLRKIDVMDLIEHQFNIKLSDKQKELIADRYVTPATFSHHSEHFNESTIDKFIKEHLMR
jgi:ATP-dependent 26S proteasome regulatory subunit